MNETETKVDWGFYSRWLYNGSSEKLSEDQLKLVPFWPRMILDHFVASPYLICLNNLFNNFDIYYLQKRDVLETLKKCVNATGIKQPYFSKKEVEEKDLFYDYIKRKYPFLKTGDISLLCKIILESDEKDSYLETAGLLKNEKEKKKKTKKSVKKEVSNTFDDDKSIPQKVEQIAKKEVVSFKDLLECFELKEV